MSSLFPEYTASEIVLQNKDYWQKEFKKHKLNYPSEYVVRFLSSIKTDSKSPKEAIDIGFGSGQHLKLLMEFGYRASGVELLSEAGELVKTLYSDYPLLGDIVIGDFRTAGFPYGKFDVVISWGVAFLRPIEEILTDIKLMHNLLRPGGKLCINFRTKDNWFYALGTSVRNDHYLLDERAGVYANSHYTFLDYDSVRHLITEAGLEIINIEQWNWSKNNMTEKHSWWIVWGRRPI